MLGAYVLAGELNEAMGDHVQAFAAYEQRLRPFILREQDAAASLARLFTPKTSLGLFVRNSVLNLMNIPPIGAWLTRRMLEKHSSYRTIVKRSAAQESRYARDQSDMPPNQSIVGARSSKHSAFRGSI